MTQASVMKWLLGVILLVSTAVSGQIRLDLVPADSTITPPGTSTLDVQVSGLDGEVIGAWSLGLLFDPAIVSIVASAFGASLGDGIYSADASSDTLSLSAVSLLSEAELDALQDDPVTLASVTLSGLTPGVSSIQFVAGTLGGVILADANGIPLEFVLGGARITVAQGAVPEPGMLLLFALGLLALAPTVRAHRALRPTRPC